MEAFVMTDRFKEMRAALESLIVPRGISSNDPVAQPHHRDLISLVTQMVCTYCTFINMVIKTRSKRMTWADKLGSIQMSEYLKQQVKLIRIHFIACNFTKRPGQVYHVYRKRDQTYYLSMLSPEEWGSSGSFQTYCGSYKLESNYCWTPV